MTVSGPLYPVNGFDPSSLKGKTLIIPSVSLGNVPQLTADLLISSLGLKRVAFLGKGDTVAPFAGNDGEILTGGLELYGNTHVFVLLQRAPTLKAKKDAHVELIGTMGNYGLSDFIVLTSLNAANQDDAQLMTPYQGIVAEKSTPTLARIGELPPLNLNTEPLNSTEPQNAETGSRSGVPFLPGGGLTRRILASLSPVGCIAAWVVEGDNRGDAVGLANVVLKILDLDIPLVQPSSWAGLFGPGEGWSGGAGLDAEIYG